MAPGIRGFIWIELANLRAGQPLLATLHPTILFHPYALMMVATWPLWLVQSIVRNAGRSSAVGYILYNTAPAE